MTLVTEYPIQKSAVDGTAITEAVCPVHKGKARTVSSDALKVAGASEVTALRCYEELSDAEKKKRGTPTPSATSLPSREFAPGASDALRASADHCQEYLVPLESRDAAGRTVRKDGKHLDKPIEPKRASRSEEQGPAPFESEGAATGGEKLAAASGATAKKSPSKRAGSRKGARKAK